MSNAEVGVVVISLFLGVVNLALLGGKLVPPPLRAPTLRIFLKLRDFIDRRIFKKESTTVEVKKKFPENPPANLYFDWAYSHEHKSNWYTWSLFRPDGSMVESQKFETKLLMIEDCVSRLRTELTDPKRIFIDANKDTREMVKEVYNKMYSTEKQMEWRS